MRKIAPLMLAGLISCNPNTPENTTERFLDAMGTRDMKTLNLVLDDESKLKGQKPKYLTKIYGRFLSTIHENLEHMERENCFLEDGNEYLILQLKKEKTNLGLYADTGIVLKEGDGNWKVTGLCVHHIYPGSFDQCKNRDGYCY